MLNLTAQDFRKELRYISERLDELAKSCENATWRSDVDRALVRQVQREKDHLALRLRGQNQGTVRGGVEQVCHGHGSIGSAGGS